MTDLKSAHILWLTRLPPFANAWVSQPRAGSRRERLARLHGRRLVHGAQERVPSGYVAKRFASCSRKPRGSFIDGGGGDDTDTANTPLRPLDTQSARHALDFSMSLHRCKGI